MPASTLDPVNAALRTALSSKSNCNSNNCNTLDSQLAGSTKKALLSNIEFEPAGSYQSSVLDKLKSKYIVLKSSEPPELSKKQNNKSETMAADEGLTAAKCELYPLKAVQLGWNNADWSVGAGMVNMGNTCYLNSTLQALFHVPALVNWLISEKQHMAECEDSGGALCIICAMRKTLQDSQQRNINSIRPYLIYNKLRVLCRNLLPGRQEDAHEFLRYLVEAMEKAYLHRFKNHSQFDSRTKETTPLNQILGGYLRSAVRCLECGNVSTTFQHFQDLLLDIRKAQTLDEALDLYFSKEKLDDDSYHCEKCQKKVTAWKQFSLERAPMVLCIQLKRFSISNNKITKQIQFRQRLDLTKYVRRRPTSPLVYRLVALVTHMGPTVNCGHYTAIAQAPSGNFYQFDDSIVKPISHQAVFGTMAYIMLYELENASFAQTNGKVKLPSTISSVTQLNVEDTQSSTPQFNGELKVYGPALPPTPKFQKLPPITQNGTFTINGSNGDHSLEIFTSNENSIEPVLKEKHVQKENKPLPSSTLTSSPLPSSSNIITKLSTDTNLNGEVKSPKSPLSIKVQNNCSTNSSPSKLPLPSPKSFISSNTINELHHNNQHEESSSNNVQTSPTKLVPYDMDDSSNCSEESHNNSGTESTSSRSPTKAALGDWKVSSSIDIKPEPSSQGNTWDKKKPNTVNELLKMSHSGYAVPVTSWNGTRSLLDKEVNNERREERKRALTDNLDQGRIKHPKLTPPSSSNGSHNNTTTSNYNPIQEYHNSKNWNNTNNGQQQQQRYRSFYNMGKRHRNDRHNYHHKNNYHKNHRFRH